MYRYYILRKEYIHTNNIKHNDNNENKPNDDY